MRPVLLILLSVLFIPATWADAPEGYPFQDFDQAMNQAREQNKTLFVYFGRYGCGYCEKTNKEAFSDDRVRQIYTDNYVLAYVDSESGKRLQLPSGERITEHEVGTRYDAFVTPVFTFMTPQGKPLKRLVGVQRIEDLLNAHEAIQAQTGDPS
ncbi:thioredoxin family protein [Thiohalophilus sp.]|uniref:thioredoxin family protein n=1 Tax=Thiohalophilus sp. TaxID=3028392 RepID=UPI002ACD451F|nr:thioredoxin family protein [Thiohalophilus sp.]MDZ7661559.1 thioredoxin family protein [Thiohalophilus sp.]